MQTVTKLRGVSRRQWWLWFWVPALATVIVAAWLLDLLDVHQRFGLWPAVVLGTFGGGGVGALGGLAGRQWLLASADAAGPWVVVETLTPIGFSRPDTEYQRGLGYEDYLCRRANVVPGHIYEDWEAVHRAARALQAAAAHVGSARFFGVMPYYE